MTVIVKTTDNKIKVLSKGADSVIFPRLRNNDNNNAIKD
jgi:magnesium-transporting ATPase (P-type)